MKITRLSFSSPEKHVFSKPIRLSFGIIVHVAVVAFVGYNFFQNVFGVMKIFAIVSTISAASGLIVGLLLSKEDPYEETKFKIIKIGLILCFIAGIITTILTGYKYSFSVIIMTVLVSFFYTAIVTVSAAFYGMIKVVVFNY